MSRKKVIRQPPIKTKNAIILGFDADVTKCGIAAYDSMINETLYHETVSYNKMSAFLQEMFFEHKKARMVARVEVATYGTAVGASKNTIARNRNKVIWGSGQSSAIAHLFIDLLKNKNVPVIEVPSNMRVNFSKFSHLDYKSIRSQILKTIQSGKFPSKLTSHQIKAMYSLKNGGNSESRDALALTIPELLLNGGF